MNKVNSNKIDLFGIVSSGLCAVHCAALPILLSFGILGSAATSSFHHSMELCVLVLSLSLAGWSSLRGWRLHGKWLPQLIIALGAFLILLGFMLATETNHTIMAIGGFVLVIGHALNHRLQYKTA